MATKKKQAAVKCSKDQAHERLEHIEAAHAAKKKAKADLIEATAVRKDALDTFNAASAELDRVCGDDEQQFLSLHDQDEVSSVTFSRGR